MKVKLNDEIVKVIESIVNHGDKAVIQRREDGVIVMAEVRHIKYKDGEIVKR